MRRRRTAGGALGVLLVALLVADCGGTDADRTTGTPSSGSGTSAADPATSPSAAEPAGSAAAEQTVQEVEDAVRAAEDTVASVAAELAAD